ncbi:uncharacterized protein LOC110414452 isoform X2 [Herrania umbratica]|uniref:Uncharacterized protein LOC110414452 isoform X2 n=1 Tax=Herrania umbratica TaxID=108875 RepID=A0A6J1A3I2_9ROSI|nr:uncharacterized protein LOC110414452 isoform X2 [Herrania umbratica]
MEENQRKRKNRMGWNYPDISLEEMMKLIKGFVDILILASGYQSSGLLAHWDSDNIKRAFQWALFFENVFRRLSSLDVYRESLEELDAALFEMASHPSFPQGLAHLSSATLRRARCYMLEHLLRNLPLRDSHLKAVLTATIEMDLSALSETEHDCLNAYLNKLTLQNRLCTGDLITSSLDVTPTVETEDSGSDNFTKLAVQELFRRQSSVSCISTIEEGLDILSKAVRQSSWTESDCSLFREKMKHESLPALLQSADASVAVFTWNQWKSRALSYFLDKRTIRLVSGASLIFSGTEVQWGKVFGQLNFSEKDSNCDIHEAIELLLLGCIASRWNYIIEHLTSVSYDSVTISKQCHMLANSDFGKSQSFHQKEDIMKSKEAGILDFLMGLLGGQVHLLWKSSAALAAISLPSWSPLFRLYLSEIETQFKGNPSAMRCCSCIQDWNEHKDCTLIFFWILDIKYMMSFQVNLLREFGVSTSFMFVVLK